MQNFDVVNWLMQQTASPVRPELATPLLEQTMVQADGANTLWQVTHAG